MGGVEAETEEEERGGRGKGQGRQSERGRGMKGMRNEVSAALSTQDAARDFLPVFAVATCVDEYYAPLK